MLHSLRYRHVCSVSFMYEDEHDDRFETAARLAEVDPAQGAEALRSIVADRRSIPIPAPKQRQDWPKSTQPRPPRPSPPLPRGRREDRGRRRLRDDGDGQ
jgi:hypothetical protein